MAVKTYRTVQGDMWDAIAYRLWGNELLLHKLMDANPRHRLAVVFPAGVTLAVPDVAAELVQKAVDPPWK
jgi:phage tail protein X